jgi:hypothetical protein
VKKNPLKPSHHINMAAPYSDLQVVSPHHSTYSGLQLPDYSGLQRPDYSGLHPREEADAAYPPPLVLGTSQEQKDVEPQNSPPKRVICGLAVRTFWILLAVTVAIVVIGAAVGGGVGGSLASRNSKKASSAADSAPSSASAQSAGATTSPTKASSSAGPVTSPPASSPTVTTTPVPGPSTTLLRDCPSSNNTLYSVDIGSVMSFRKICNLSYRNSLGETSVVDSPTTSLDDCINLCAAYNVQNMTEIAAGSSSLCNAVCWRNTFDNADEFPGQCFGYTTQNSSNAFVVESEAICDSAAWINQSF